MDDGPNSIDPLVVNCVCQNFVIRGIWSGQTRVIFSVAMAPNQDLVQRKRAINASPSDQKTI